MNNIITIILLRNIIIGTRREARAAPNESEMIRQRKENQAIAQLLLICGSYFIGYIPYCGKNLMHLQSLATHIFARNVNLLAISLACWRKRSVLIRKKCVLSFSYPCSESMTSYVCKRKKKPAWEVDFCGGEIVQSITLQPTIFSCSGTALTYEKRLVTLHCNTRLVPDYGH